MSTRFTLESRGGVLDIESAYKSIAKLAMGPDSPYIRAKDTLLAYFESDGVGKDLSAREKADMLAELVEKMSIGLSTDLMNLSVKIAIENRDAPYNLAKVVADVKGKNIANDKDLEDSKMIAAKTKQITVDTDKTVVEAMIEQANTRSKVGVTIGGHGTIPSAATAITYNSASDVLDAKLKELNEYTVMADAYRKTGSDNQLSLVTSGTTKKLVVVKGTAEGTDNGLTWAQSKVAIRQEQGFTDNMWQHAANSAANTIGLLMSSGDSSMVNDGVRSKIDGSLVNRYAYALEKLLTVPSE